VVVLVRVGLPEHSEQWKFKFLSPVLPIVIDILSELLNMFISQQILVLLLQKGHHPPFASRKVHILARLELHFDHGLLQEFVRENPLVFVDVSVLMCLDEGVVHLCEFIVVGLRKV
jgi:hypothetical protein